MKRLTVRLAVVLTALLCLGTAGYAGQVWWAEKICSRLVFINVYEDSDKPQFGLEGFLDVSEAENSLVLIPLDGEGGNLAQTLRLCPWYGRFVHGVWVPRMTYALMLERLTGRPPSNDPDVWKAWLKAHPNLVWNAKQKKLVEKAGGTP